MILKSIGLLLFKFVSFTECQKSGVDCDKYLDSLSKSSEVLPQSAYKVKYSSFPIPLAEGLLRYDLVTPFYVQENVYIMIDQSLGGRISIDTSHPNDLLSDYAFEGNRISKVSMKSDVNWKFTIRALAAPFELVTEPTTTTTTPNKSSANTSPGFTLLVAMLLLSQI